MRIQKLILWERDIQKIKKNLTGERKIFCAYENKYSFMAMIKILNQCQ